MKKLLLLSLLVLMPYSAGAATISFVPERAISGVGQEVRVTVFADTSEELNAFEGSVVVPSNLSILRVEDGNSIVTLWLKRPTDEGGQISFSGVTPGGFVGQGRLFSFVVKVAKEGEGAISFSRAQFLKNDGEGTVATAQGTPLDFSVQGMATDQSPALIDNTSPESFVPTIGSNEALFDGKLFVAFTTQDKGVGIDHYTVQESSTRFGLWISPAVRAESPYQLLDQSGHSYVKVTAFDKNGNTRSAAADPLTPGWGAALINILVFVCVLILIGYFVRRMGTR